MKLLERINAEHRRRVAKRYSLTDYVSWFNYNGIEYPLLGFTSTHSDRERIDHNFVAYAQQAYKSDGIVFACMLARMLLFSEARFLWQRLENGRPGDLFGNRDLRILEEPWPNGSTGSLLSRMIQDADIGGNFYAVREANRLRRLRPDWVDIVLTAPPDQAVESDIVGYLYYPGGDRDAATAVPYTVEEVVHWAPIPDPEAEYRGMSWLTSVLREIEADKAATAHKLKFFQNAATPNLAVSFSEKVTEEQGRRFMQKFNEAHQGTGNAYKTLFLGAGADVKVVGADLRQLDFKATQGAGETRIAAAAAVHPTIVGLSEGLQGSSLNEGNFAAARRLTADKLLRPLWRSAAAALQTVLPRPSNARLWFDDRDIAFLREDERDLADIQGIESRTIRTLLDAGYDGESVIQAVVNRDWTLLRHTGLFSVQLQPPTTAQQLDAALQDDQNPAADVGA